MAGSSFEGSITYILFRIRLIVVRSHCICTLYTEFVICNLYTALHFLGDLTCILTWW